MSGMYDELKSVMDTLSTKRPVLEKMTEGDAYALIGPMIRLDYHILGVIAGARRVLEIIERIEIDQQLATDHEAD